MFAGPPAGGLSLTIVAEAWMRDLHREDWARMDSVPELGSALPEPAPRRVSDLAAEYVRLFVVNVPPHESLFLESPEAVHALSRLYAEAGWMPPGPARDLPADHVAVQLLALAALERAGDAPRAQRLVSRHLAAFVPALAWSARRLLPPAFYTALIELTLDMVLSRLREGTAGNGLPSTGSVADGPAAGPLEGLLSPTACGCYIPRGELMRIAQWLCVPVPSGGRAEMFAGLLRSSRDRGVAASLLDALDNLIDDARLDYEGLLADYPAWRDHGAVWQGRLAGGKAAVAALRAGV